MKKLYVSLVLLLGCFAARAQFPAPYCAENFSDGVEPITSVVFNTINNTSTATVGTTAHQDFTAISTTVNAGATYSISVQGNTDGAYPDGIRVFIDFNNNGSFTDNGESFTVGAIYNSTGTDGITATGSITIPTTATAGAKRMRVIKLFFAYPDPCNVDGYGQAEDYTVNVLAPPCAFPSNLRFTSLSGTNASISWTAASGVSSYQYAITASSTPPASGTATSSTSASVSGLPSNTTLYAYVRSVCAAANTFTPWVSLMANDSCGTPIRLTKGATVAGTTVGSTRSLPGVSCAGSTNTAAQDVWYSFTADNNGTATVTLTPVSTDYDGVLVAYSGSCGALTYISCADEGFNNDNEVITLSNLVAGQVYRIRVYDWSGGGQFTLSVTGSALPVTGITLAAVRSNKNVQLGWQTLTEINNAGFELQRSADASSFTSFIKVASKAPDGNSTNAISYAAEDVKPFAGATYYRLKQTDRDGKISYSNTAVVKGLTVSNLTLSAIYPNPTRDVLKAAIQSPNAERVTFVISDMTGKNISRQTTSVSAGDNTVSLNVANLPSGNYLLKVICSAGCETAMQKFTKQ